jgi:5'-nucleotidase
VANGTRHAACRSSASKDAAERAAAQAALEAMLREREDVARRHKARLEAHHVSFHPVWGQMMKAGFQNSMYASLLERFACLYTSHVSNLTLYSPYMKFRAGVDVMAHEAADEDETSAGYESPGSEGVRGQGVGAGAQVAANGSHP